MPDKPKVTPKDFFLWAGAMITLYVSVFAFLSLIFNYLNYAYPDALAYYASDPYQGGVAYEMATLIVLVPLATWLLMVIQGTIRRDATRAEIWVRRWALYLTLFAAGATIAGDLITLIMYFLQGETPLRFLLKVLVVALVAGGGLLHFLADLRGYWLENPRKCRAVAWAVGALVLITIIAGFFIIGTPWQARLYRYDEQKVSDLQNIQYALTSYYQAHQKLPDTLGALNDPLTGFVAPTDPQTGKAYTYVPNPPAPAIGHMIAPSDTWPKFELCATFNAPTRPGAAYQNTPMMPTPYGAQGGKPDSWQHGAGQECFTRTIDPANYPPLTQKAAP